MKIMPLYPNALDLIKINLDQLSAGQRPRFVSIGYLTDTQHAAVNVIRAKNRQPLLEGKLVIFLGRHFHESRTADGYTVSDMMVMIESSMSEQSVPQGGKSMTGMMNHTQREDGYGNKIKDLAVFELYAKRPKAELLSVVPKGDSGNRPIDQKQKTADLQGVTAVQNIAET